MNRNQILINFNQHRLTPKAETDALNLNKAFLNLALLIDDLIPISVDRTLALRNLEVAKFYANAALARSTATPEAEAYTKVVTSTEAGAKDSTKDIVNIIIDEKGEITDGTANSNTGN